MQGWAELSCQRKYRALGMERAQAQSACLFYHVCTCPHLRSRSMIQRGTRRRRSRLQENHQRGRSQARMQQRAEPRRGRMKCVSGEISERDAHSA
jgi:hypothetical protein